MRKAQVAAQVFIFMLAFVLAALILLYGYKAIFGQGGFINRADQIALVRFETDLSSAVISTSSDYGSVKKLELNVPSKYRKVCLADLSKSGSGDICTQGSNYNPIACDAWKDKAQNVFVIGSTSSEMNEKPIKISALDIEDGSICIPVRLGKITLRLEGLGDRTKVSEWS